MSLQAPGHMLYDMLHRVSLRSNCCLLSCVLLNYIHIHGLSGGGGGGRREECDNHT